MLEAPPRAADHRLRLEDVVVARAHVEADGPCDAVFPGIVHQQVRHADPVVDLVSGLLGSLGHDRLIGLAVDHDLPAAFAKVVTRLRVLHDRQAPFLELVHRRIHVTRHVEEQILAHHPHQVDAGVADVIFRVVLAPARAHVAVDRVEALCDGAGAVDIGLLGDDDLFVLTPETGLPGGPGASKTRPNDKNVDIVFNDGFMGHQ